MATAFKDEAFIRKEVAGIEQWLASLLAPSQSRYGASMFVTFLRFAENRTGARFLFGA